MTGTITLDGSASKKYTFTSYEKGGSVKPEVYGVRVISSNHNNYSISMCEYYVTDKYFTIKNTSTEKLEMTIELYRMPIVEGGELKLYLSWKS